MSSEPRRASSECERALADLVRELESDDFRNPAGVKATRTAAYLNAKALVSLISTLSRRPRPD